MAPLIPMPPDALYRGIGMDSSWDRPRGGFSPGFAAPPRSTADLVPGTGVNNFNASPATVPAYGKFGFLIAMTTSDVSTDAVGMMTGFTGWLFTRIYEHIDATNTESFAFYIGRPDPILNRISTASGTSITLQGGTFRSFAIGQFVGTLRGQVVARSAAEVTTGNTSVTVSAPQPYVPGTVSIVGGLTRSGGAGLALGTDPLLPDIGGTPAGLGSLRVGYSNGSTTFTRASGTSGLGAIWLLVR